MGGVAISLGLNGPAMGVWGEAISGISSNSLAWTSMGDEERLFKGLSVMEVVGFGGPALNSSSDTSKTVEPKFESVCEIGACSWPMFSDVLLADTWSRKMGSHSSSVSGFFKRDSSPLVERGIDG